LLLCVNEMRESSDLRVALIAVSAFVFAGVLLAVILL